jgi:hypothetical protein
MSCSHHLTIVTICESLPWEPPTGYPNQYLSNSPINRTFHGRLPHNSSPLENESQGPNWMGKWMR